MLYFAAENFHLMADLEAEESMCRRMLPEFKFYSRLVSFAFKKEAETVFRIKRLPDLKDKVIEVKAELLSKPSPWSGTINVLEILKDEVKEE